MKTGIVGIMNNPSTSENSHSAGWNEIQRQLIDPHSVILNESDNWLDYDQIVINHGPNFKEGSFNIIGGINDSVINRANKLIEFKNIKNKIYQIDDFQMEDFIVKRKLNLFWNGKIEKFNIDKRSKLIIGDSHSISMWPGPEYSIERNDGKTLFGFLKNPKKADILYFGNIDIRFHLCRQQDPVASTIDLCERYIDFANSCKAKVSCLLPIESESRKVPQSGMYKRQPFYGSRELRSKLVNIFNGILLKSGLDVNVWPNEWYSNISFYEKEIMEPKQSVHIRPKYYARNIKHKQINLF